MWVECPCSPTLRGLHVSARTESENEKDVDKKCSSLKDQYKMEI